MRFRLVPAAYVLLLRASPAGDEVLLQLRRGTGFMDGYWACAAAGHVEAGESVRSAAAREATEELGVHIRTDALDPITAMHRTQATGDPIDERVDFFFGCRDWQGEPRRMEPAKSADLRWFPLDALPDPLVPHELAVLEGVRAGTLPPIVTFGFDADAGHGDGATV
jgi:8-oxo-dGTP diphosphatase